MSYVIYSPDKILRIKHELHLLTEQGLDRLKKLIDFREYSVKAKENYQEINQNIKALVA